MDKLIPYQRLCSEQRRHPLLLSEVPVEFFVSPLLPTRRFGPPGYAAFASATRRIPGKPILQSAPNRWWGFDAATGKLLLYSHCRVFSFAGDKSWAETELAPPPRTLQEQQALFEDLHHHIERSDAPFFFGEELGGNFRAEMRTMFESLFPLVLPQLSALAPDFFSWLT